MQTDIAQGGFLSHPSHIKSKFVAGGKTMDKPPLYDLAIELAIDNGTKGDTHEETQEDPNDEIDLDIHPQKLTKVYIKEEADEYHYDKATNLLFIEEGTGNYLAVGLYQEGHSVEWFP